jgi:hypothetical protein
MSAVNQGMLKKILSNHFVRWVCVLPAALLAVALGNLAVYLVILLTFFSPNHNDFTIIFASGIVTGWAFIFVGVWLAPSKKVSVAIGLFALLSFWLGALWIVGFIEGAPRSDQLFLLVSLLAGAAATYDSLRRQKD